MTSSEERLLVNLTMSVQTMLSDDIRENSRPFISLPPCFQFNIMEHLKIWEYEKRKKSKSVASQEHSAWCTKWTERNRFRQGNAKHNRSWNTNQRVNLTAQHSKDPTQCLASPPPPSTIHRKASGLPQNKNWYELKPKKYVLRYNGAGGRVANTRALMFVCVIPVVSPEN